MCRNALVIACVALVPVGCHPKTQPEQLPGYDVVVPAEVPERLVIREKDGTTTEVNGRELYAWAHREGWADFWRRYQRGEVDPGDKTAEPIAMGEPSLAARARHDGFEACRQMVLRTESHHR